MDETETETTNQPIEQLVRRVHQNDLSRSRFIVLLTGLGASTAGIATLLASPEEARAATLPPCRIHTYQAVQSQNKHLHAAHVQRQAHATQQPGRIGSSGGAPVAGVTAPVGTDAGTLNGSHVHKLQVIMNDYADHAMVEDPFFAEPIVGKEAIAQRKLAEMASIRDATIEVTHRFAYHNQVVAEWVMRGTHAGLFLGYPGTGRQIEVRGVTVVTREQGKITKESLHYDAADVHRQLS